MSVSYLILLLVTWNPDTRYNFAGNVTFDPLARLGGVAPDLGSEFVFGPGLEFAFDLENRVTSIHRDTNNGQSNVNDPTGEPKVMAFAYDALGRRVETTEYVDAATGELMDGASGHANPRKTRHVYFGLETIQEYACGADGSAANLPDEWACSMGMPLVREYVWGDPDRFPEVVAMIRHNPDTQDEFVYHYLHDILGSVIGLVAFDGTLVERYVYDPYGKVFIERWDEDANEGQGDWLATAEPVSGLAYSSFRNPFMFTGHRYDAAVGLYHTWARSYSPWLGRALQRDPIEYESGSPNLYEWVLSAPLYWIDPYGLEPQNDDPFAEADRQEQQVKRAIQQVNNVASAAQTGLEVAARLHPISDVIEGATGKDIITGEEVGLGERATACVAFIPIVGCVDDLNDARKIAKALKKGEKAKDAADDAKDAAKVCKTAKKRNGFGSKGKPDHRQEVDRLEKKARKEKKAGETVEREKKIKGHKSNRQPDVQIIDKNGKTRKAFEAERHPTWKRNRKREAEYDDLGIEQETHPL